MLFSDDNDVKHIVDKLIEETRETNRKMGTSFDIGKSITSQIGFFACKNIFIKQEYQQDIAKHMYCIEYSVPPYPGSYGDQPALWHMKSQIIKNALIKRENSLYEKVRNKEL